MMRIWLSSEEMPVILLGNLEIKSRNVSLERMENNCEFTKLSNFIGVELVPTEKNVSRPSYNAHENLRLPASWLQPVIGE